MAGSPVRPRYVPSLRRGVAAVESEAALGREMCGDGAEQRDLVGFGQEGLEGMAGHDDEVELPAEANFARIAVDPLDLLIRGVAAGDVEHRPRRIDPDPASADRLQDAAGDRAGAATEIE